MSKPLALGIDVGGTKTLCVLADRHGKILRSIKFKTAPENGARSFVKNLVRSSRSLVRAAKQKKGRVIAVGVGFAGRVNPATGRIKASPNLLCLEGLPVGELLENELKVPVVIGNDVQLGLAGEHKWGAARGHQHVLGVFFGTGIGGAAIIHNRLYKGASGSGGQVGAVLAQPVGGPKAALSHGILDRIASKSAIATEALVMAIKEWAPYLHKKVEADLSRVTWGAIRRAIEHGDKKIEDMLRARLRVVGIALSSIVNFLNPEMVVLGGGLVGEMPKLVIREIKKGLCEYLSPEVEKFLTIRRAALQTHSVAIGAACEAFDEWSDRGKP
jgi:glucokinase